MSLALERVPVRAFPHHLAVADLPILAAGQNSERGDEWWAVSAAVLIAIALMMVLAGCLSRLMRSGSLGAIKVIPSTTRRTGRRADEEAPSGTACAVAWGAGLAQAAARTTRT